MLLFLMMMMLVNLIDTANISGCCRHTIPAASFFSFKLNEDVKQEEKKFSLLTLA